MGFSILHEFPGRFLRGEDVVGHTVDLVIKTVKKEKAYSFKEKKEIIVLVIYFEGKERGVRLGKERAMDLKELFGDDTDKWLGKSVQMYTQNKDIFGKNVNVIRFRKAEDTKKLSRELDEIALSESQNS